VLDRTDDWLVTSAEHAASTKSAISSCLLIVSARGSRLRS
jgi:hypothetical protein